MKFLCNARGFIIDESNPGWGVGGGNPEIQDHIVQSIPELLSVNMAGIMV